MRDTRALLAAVALVFPLTVFGTGGEKHPSHGNGKHESHEHGHGRHTHRPPVKPLPPSPPTSVVHQTQTTQVRAEGGSAHVGNVTATGGAGGNAVLTIRDGALSPSASATGGSVTNSGNSSASAVIAPGAVQNSNRNENNNTAIASSGDSTSTSSAVVGDINNEVNIAAPRAIAPAAELPQVGTHGPLLPYQMGRPANVAGIEVSEVFDILCGGLTVTSDLSPIIGEGREGKTMHVFVPHPNYRAFAKSGVRPQVDLVHIKHTEKRASGKCVCLGILQGEAIEKHASVVNRSLLQNQSMLFAAEELEGFASVLLVDARVALSVNFGQGALGSGFGVGPGLSNPFGAALATLGLNVSDTKGHTFGKAQLGNTYIVLANVPAEEIPSGAATLDPAEFRSELANVLRERIAEKNHGESEQHHHHHN